MKAAKITPLIKFNPRVWMVLLLPDVQTRAIHNCDESHTHIVKIPVPDWRSSHRCHTYSKNHISGVIFTAPGWLSAGINNHTCETKYTPTMKLPVSCYLVNRFNHTCGAFPTIPVKMLNTNSWPDASNSVVHEINAGTVGTSWAFQSHTSHISDANTPHIHIKMLRKVPRLYPNIWIETKFCCKRILYMHPSFSLPSLREPLI